MNDAATVSHAVSGGGYGSVTVPDVTVTVSDDETASASVALTVSPSSVDEAAGATAITVTGTLNGAARNSDTAVTVTVSAGTASTGDFAAVQDFTLTITTGQISGTATFRLTPVDDTIDEDDETVRVAGTVQGLTVTAGTVTVEDDDEQGVRTSATALTVPEGDSRIYTVALRSQPAGPVTVTPSVAGSADVTVSGALTFTAQNWNRAQTVTVSAAQDADAANDAATVSHAVSGGGYGSVTAPDVAVTVEDLNEPGIEVSATALTVPEGDSRTYTVALRSQPAGPVTVTPSVAGSADVTVSGALTFTAQNWNRAQTVTVSAAQDADAANDAATVSHAVSGGGYGSVTVPDVAVTVEDLNEPGIEVSATALTVPEGDSRTYTVALRSQPAGPVTVTPSVAGSADVTVRPAALTFTAQNWDQAQTVTVSAAQDADAANDAATVSHAVSGGGYGSVTVPDVAVTVEDDDRRRDGRRSALTVSPGTVNEDAGAADHRGDGHPERGDPDVRYGGDGVGVGRDGLDRRLRSGSGLHTDDRGRPNLGDSDLHADAGGRQHRRAGRDNRRGRDESGPRSDCCDGQYRKRRFDAEGVDRALRAHRGGAGAESGGHPHVGTAEAGRRGACRRASGRQRRDGGRRGRAVDLSAGQADRAGMPGGA